MKDTICLHLQGSRSQWICTQMGVVYSFSSCAQTVLVSMQGSAADVCKAAMVALHARAAAMFADRPKACRLILQASTLSCDQPSLFVYASPPSCACHDCDTEQHDKQRSARLLTDMPEQP